MFWKKKEDIVGEYPHIANGIQMKRMLSACGTHGRLLDQRYYLPNDKYIEAMLKFHRQDVERNGLTEWEVVADCDNHAVRCFSNAQTFFARNPVKYADAVAVGLLVYTPESSSEDHMICYVCKSGYILSFWETVSCVREIELTKKEKASVSLVFG